MRHHHWAHFYFKRGPVRLSWSDFLSPLSLGGVAVMGFNDAWLRVEHSNFITGKLSDIAVLLFFPLFMLACWNTIRATIAWCAGCASHCETTTTMLRVSIAATGIIFTALQISPGFVDFYVSFLDYVNVLPFFQSFHYTPDPSDLLTLPCLYGCYRYGIHRLNRFALEVAP